jgi:hypothetical protein
MIRRWQTSPDLIPPADRPAFATLDELLRRPAETVTLDARSGVSRLQLTATYYVKVFAGPGNRLQHLLGIGRYRRERRNLALFASMGLATPALAAHGHDLRWGLLQRAALVTREVPAASTLRDLMVAGQLYRGGVYHARRILGELARAMRQLHRAGFYHGDLKARNILVQDTGETPRLVFFDCPRGYRPPRWRLRDRIVRELAHLHHDLAKGGVRRADRLYAYKIYRDCRRLSPADKVLAREALAYYGQRSMTRRRRRRLAEKQRAAGPAD